MTWTSNKEINKVFDPGYFISSNKLVLQVISALFLFPFVDIRFFPPIRFYAEHNLEIVYLLFVKNVVSTFIYNE